MSYSENLDQFLGFESPEKKEDWDFAGSNTKSYTHGIHPYPARMIPQVASRLINRYSSEKQLNFDPFCGSGTVLMECILLNRNSIGNDVNPFARILTKVKTTPINPDDLDHQIGKILDLARKNIEGYRDGNLRFEDIKPLDFPNISLWFKPKIIHELCLIRDMISEVESKDIRDFLKICFSNTVRRTSNANRDGDTFIKRMPERQLANFRPDTYAEFAKTVTYNVLSMKNYWRIYSSLEDPKPTTRILAEDARNLSLHDCAVDNIITSPPYGEERNTISYVRWSKLLLFWLGFTREEVLSGEKLTLGSRNTDTSKVESSTLYSILEIISKENEKLASEAELFFKDYLLAMKELYRVIKPGGHCCIVLGNRSLLRRRIPMDKITVDLGNSLGFMHIITYYRNIPTKSIPWIVAKGDTIASENLIILKK